MYVQTHTHTNTCIENEGEKHIQIQMCVCVFPSVLDTWIGPRHAQTLMRTYLYVSQCEQVYAGKHKKHIGRYFQVLHVLCQYVIVSNCACVCTRMWVGDQASIVIVERVTWGIYGQRVDLQFPLCHFFIFLNFQSCCSKCHLRPVSFLALLIHAAQMCHVFF